ncbi:hypothetical protein J6590_030121 [Homalodisca vitripennis]|nr:hypothetical protein J6590_030121 [Homalodisca vitripennis]
MRYLTYENLHWIQDIQDISEWDWTPFVILLARHRVIALLSLFSATTGAGLRWLGC